MFSGEGFTGHLSPPAPGLRDHEYIGNADAKASRATALAAYLERARYVLSGTANLHRALLSAGVDWRLVVFDALPHVFWYDPQLPESLEANHIMADFMIHELSGK